MKFERRAREKNSGDIGTIKNCELTRARHAITRGV